MTVCIVGNIIKALKGETNGGAELQLSYIARVFYKLNYSVYVFDSTITEDICIDGIIIIRINSKQIDHILKKANYIYVRIRSHKLYLWYLKAKVYKIKVIYACASDLDLSNLYMRIRYFYIHKSLMYLITQGIITEILYTRALKKMDYIFTQYPNQGLIKLNKNYIGNIYNMELVFDIEKNNEYVYVGSLDKRKGFNYLYKLIKAFPDLKIKIIGDPRDNYAKRILNILKYYDNVRILGRLHYSKTIKEIACSKALISTSPMEGFPNIFLEAWANNTPVISLHVGLGGIIDSNNLGIFCESSFDRLVQVLSNDEINKKKFENTRQYVKNNHSFEVVCERVKKVLST